MCKLILTILFFLVSTQSAISQPGEAWLRMYDDGGRERFRDLYRVAGEGYIMCGRILSAEVPDTTGNIWVVRVDNDGQEIWTHTYSTQNQMQYAYSIIETDNGNFVMTGISNSHVTALRIDGEGELIWWRNYARGYGSAVIELKGGDFLIAGVASYRNDYPYSRGYLLCIDGNGEVLWEETYIVEGCSRNKFTSMRETVGGVVVAGYVSPDVNTWLVWVMKVSLEEEGEVIWERFYGDEQQNICQSMVSSHDGGFVLTGTYNDGGGFDHHSCMDLLVMKIDGDGDLQWARSHDFGGFEQAWCIDRLDDGGFAVVGHWGGGRGPSVPFAARLTPDGIERWNATYRWFEEDGYGDDENYLFSVVMGHDGSILAAGAINYEEDGSDKNGLLIKLEPEHLEPQFIIYSPEDTMFTVLQGDPVEFWVRAHDAQGDEMSYLWIMGEDTLSRDTTVTVIFDELGDFEMQCQVSDGEFIISITWYVRVMAFYIESFTPDTLEMTVRRISSVDFALEVRALADVEVNYLWTLIGRGQERQVGEEESVTVLFDLTGDHRLEGMVWSDEEADVVDWTIHVRSVIWYWWPEENELSLPVDSRQEFAVFPFNPDSDSLSFRWYLNDEQLEFDITEDVITVEFPDVGDQTLASFVKDGIEVDMVTWEIEVFDPRGTTSDDVAPLPDCISLFDPRPNPFNASTTISYQLPEPGEVSIGIYDIHGRLVTALVDGRIAAGYHHAVWDGSGVPSGIYFCRMYAVGYSRCVKMVLVR